MDTNVPLNCKMIVFIIGFLSNVFGICCDIDQDQYQYLLKKGIECGVIDDDEIDALDPYEGCSDTIEEKIIMDSLLKGLKLLHFLYE